MRDARARKLDLIKGLQLRLARRVASVLDIIPRFRDRRSTAIILFSINFFCCPIATGCGSRRAGEKATQLEQNGGISHRWMYLQLVRG